MRRATDTTLENHLNRIISIHALHEENDGDAVEDRADLRISIHALHEESDVLHRVHRHLQPISIHALHEESDRPRKRSTSGIVRFQSTLSMRRARSEESAVSPHLGISIHALHEESDDDKRVPSTPTARNHFNPRSP